MIHRKVSPPAMAHDESSNSVETDDAQHDADELLSETARAKRRVDDESSSEASPAPTNGRSHDRLEETSGDDLDDSVEGLISDAVSAVESIQDDLDAGAAPSDEDAHAVDEIAEKVDHLVEEAAHAIRDGATRETVAVVEFEDDFDDDDDTSSPAPVSAPESSHSTPAAPVVDDSPQTIEALDAKIEAEAAAFEEELDELEGDFHSAEEVEALDDALPPTAKADQERVTVEIDDDVAEISLEDEDDEPVVEIAPSSRPAVDSPFADAANAPARPAAPKKAEPKQTAPVAAKPSGAKQKTKRIPWKAAAPALYRLVLTPLARPLGKLDPVVRDSIGWIGLNTLFIALCLWIYLILR